MEKNGGARIISLFLVLVLCFSIVLAANSSLNQSTSKVNVTNLTILESNLTMPEVNLTLTEVNLTITEVNVTNITVPAEPISEVNESIVAIEEETNKIDPTLLASYNAVKCKTNFATALVGTIMASDFSAIYLAGYASNLQEDLAQLSEFTNSNNSEGYSSYLKENYEGSIAKENEAVGEWKKNAYELISAQAKNKVRGDYAVIDAKYKVCLLDPIKAQGNERVKYFNSILDSYSKKADSLELQGVAVPGLKKVIGSARVEIINSMQKEISSSNEPKTITNVIKKYCLFEGCKDGVNYHLAAKWEVAKLKLMLEKINAKSNKSNSDVRVTNLAIAIYNAESAMTYAGTSPFTVEQNKQVGDNIKEGYNLVKQIAEKK